MSIFLGIIEEIPGISVDRFDGCNLSSSAYFLSHCHSDHTKGLDPKFFDMLAQEHKYLYCSKGTKVIIQNKFGHSAFVKGLEVDSPVCISYNLNSDEQAREEYLDVTCISANHCIGSVMFLFNKKNLSILYTGDFRLSPSQYTNKLRSLHYKGSLGQSAIKLSNIYLDTTFLDSNYPDFPSREESIKKIREAAEDWLCKDPENIVVLRSPSPYGYESLYMELSQLLKCKICVKPYVYTNYIYIPGFRDYVTDDPNSTRIRAFGGKSLKVLMIWVSAMRWKNSDSSVAGKWENGRFNICYSTHCSFNELKAFIEYFKPCKLVPCVYPNDRTKEETESLVNDLLKEDNSTCVESQEYSFACSEAQILKIQSFAACSSSNNEDWF